MANAAYEERRNQEAERRLAEERKANKRIAREVAADELFDVLLPALKDFFEGKACLLVDPIDDQRIAIRFSRG